NRLGGSAPGADRRRLRGLDHRRGQLRRPGRHEGRRPANEPGAAIEHVGASQRRTGTPSGATCYMLLARQPRSAQILTADSVQQQPIAAPEGSESNHGIHRNTRKRESESTSPFRVLPGGNSRPEGGVVPWLRVCDDLSCLGNNFFSSTGPIPRSTAPSPRPPFSVAGPPVSRDSTASQTGHGRRAHETPPPDPDPARRLPAGGEWGSRGSAGAR